MKSPAHFPGGRLHNNRDIKYYYATDLNVTPAGEKARKEWYQTIIVEEVGGDQHLQVSEEEKK